MYRNISNISLNFYDKNYMKSCVSLLCFILMLSCSSSIKRSPSSVVDKNSCKEFVRSLYRYELEFDENTILKDFETNSSLSYIHDNPLIQREEKVVLAKISKAISLSGVSNDEVGSTLRRVISCQ